MIPKPKVVFMTRRTAYSKITLICLLLSVILFVPRGYSADNDFSGKDYTTETSKKAAEQAAAKKREELKKLEEEEKKTEEKIKEEAQDVQEAQKAVEEAESEQETLAKEIKLKEEEAKVAQKELEVLKKEAETTKDRDRIKEAEKLEEAIKKLQAEAAAQKKRLSLAEEKEALAEKRLAKEQLEIEQVRAELEELRTQKAGLSPLLSKLIRSGTVILVGLVLFILLRMGIRTLEKVVKKEGAIRESEIELRVKTLGRLFNWLGGILIVLSVSYQLLSIYGVNVGPLIAGAGIVGIAFGFGGQYLIRDLINGIFILVEGQFRINDVVKIENYGGLVEDINLRITTLRDLAGRVIIIPNGEIKTVVNFTKGYAQALFDIGVAYKENVDRVMEVIKQVGAQMREDEYFGRLILDDLEMFGVDEFADSAVIIKFRIKTRPIKQWEVSREFKRRLKNRFDELDIEIPFPHTTFYWGSGDDNKWFKQTMGTLANK
ncbi:MAG: mechanosensitive ion channel [Candidatus Omnitrophica bacterium]|nr:mechanosensitive ion channel [Candidatus Omnitrophota bacterium]